jgi:antibiotic biosynthesis monooxygenase (ABM) superfamily enzyme
VIRHVVMFKLKPGVSPAQRDEWLEMSRQLHGEIDLVRSFSIGADLLRLPRSYDVAVVADFDNLEDVQAYADHPTHLATVELSRELSEHIVSADFEV